MPEELGLVAVVALVAIVAWSAQRAARERRHRRATWKPFIATEDGWTLVGIAREDSRGEILQREVLLSIPLEADDYDQQLADAEALAIMRAEALRTSARTLGAAGR